MSLGEWVFLPPGEGEWYPVKVWWFVDGGEGGTGGGCLHWGRVCLFPRREERSQTVHGLFDVPGQPDGIGIYFQIPLWTFSKVSKQSSLLRIP